MDEHIKFDRAPYSACRTALVLIAALSALALLAPGASSAQEAFRRPGYGDRSGMSADEVRIEVERIMENLQNVISDFATENSLNSREIDNYQRQLSRIYRDLDTLSSRLGGSSPYPDPGPGNWQPFSGFTRSISPRDARFTGWSSSADINYSVLGRGALQLTIDNYNYQAELVIQRAYRGDANISIQSDASGSVVLTVNDNDGMHEYLVQDGGLGPVFVHGRNIDTSGPAGGWGYYASATSRVVPSGSRFTAWRQGADVSFDLAPRGVIILDIDNVDYRARWTIEHGYEGGAEVRVHSVANGDVVLTVSDNNGTHEFLVQEGGLGQILYRER